MMLSMGLLFGGSVAWGAPPSSGKSPTERCTLRIASPAPNTGASPEVTVMVQGRVPRGKHVWVLARRSSFERAGWFWPQGEGKLESLGVWMVPATLGVARDAGHQFDIAAMAVSNEEHRKLEAYLKTALVTGKWSPIEAPKAACSAQITVRRK